MLYEVITLCLMTKTYNGSTILLAMNMSKLETKTIDLSEWNVPREELKAYLVVDEDQVSMESGILVLPPCSIAVIR